MFKYFVSYKHEFGYGRCEITRDEEIKGIDDIFGIEKSISENNGLSKVVVLYYKLF